MKLYLDIQFLNSFQVHRNRSPSEASDVQDLRQNHPPGHLDRQHGPVQPCHPLLQHLDFLVSDFELIMAVVVALQGLLIDSFLASAILIRSGPLEAGI